MFEHRLVLLVDLGVLLNQPWRLGIGHDAKLDEMIVLIVLLLYLANVELSAQLVEQLRLG